MVIPVTTPTVIPVTTPTVIPVTTPTVIPVTTPTVIPVTMPMIIPVGTARDICQLFVGEFEFDLWLNKYVHRNVTFYL
jgi:hypothetical protein